MNDVESGVISDSQAPIDPLQYLGRDLRDIPEEEVSQILSQYGTLRNTADGYCLGQALSVLRAARGGADNSEGLKAMLNDDNEWIFKGSKARQEQEKHQG